MSRLRHEDFRLPLPKIFELDTVAAMAGFLIQSQSSKEEEEEGDSSSAPLTTHQMESLRQTQAHTDANYIFYSLTRRTTAGDKPAPTPTCLRRAWEKLFQRYDIYRAKLDLASGLQTICDSPSYKWSEFSADNVEQVQLISTRERDALWTRLRAQERPTSPNMPEFWIVYVPGEITQMNRMIHHTYTDAWSLGIVLRDLEALLEDADRVLPPAPGFLPLARRLATRATRDQDAINTSWREYAHPHAKEVRLLKLPPQSLSTFVATSLDQEDGHTSRKEVPGISKASLDTFARTNGVSPATVIYTAWKLVLAARTGSSIVGTELSVLGRALDFPNVDRIVGSLNRRCALLFKFSPVASLSMTMMELQRTYHAVNEWQWTYPHFRQHVLRLAGHTERGFPVCLVLLDMPVAGLWDVRELQLLGTGSQPMNRDEKGERITVHIVQRGDAISVHFGYDRKRYDHETVVDLQEHFVAVLQALCSGGTNLDVATFLTNVSQGTHLDW